MGLFSRKTYADAIYENAKVITLDPEYPNAAAVAVKDGKILRVGEFKDVEDLIGKETVRFDLGGRFLCPGFIKMQAAPADAVFSDFFDKVREDMEPEEMRNAVAEYAQNNDQNADYEALFKLSEEFASEGYTSMCGINSNNIIVNMLVEILMDAYSAGLIKQRYYRFDTIKGKPDPRLVVRMLEGERLNCLELGGLVNFAGLCPVVNEENFSGEYLESCLDAVCDKGYDVRVFASGRDVALKCYDILGNLSSSNKNCALMLCTDKSFTDEDLAEVYTGNVVLKPYTLTDGGLLDRTINAAAETGLSALGSIEEGKAADFAVFDNNPEEAFKDGSAGDLRAYMTVVAGRPVYGPGCGNAEDWKRQMLAEMDVLTGELGEYIEPEYEEDSDE